MPLNNVSNKINSWITENYGSRRGAILTYKYRVLCLFGKYRKYRQINWGSIDRLVFVCKGNICRSAYAEAVARSIGVDSISCGIDTVIGAPANEQAIKISSMRGFDLSKHKTTPVQSLTFKENDLLIAMEPWQVEYLHHNLSVDECSLLGLWGRPVTPHIHDPYGSSSHYFDNCFNYIENSVYEIARKISQVGS